MREKRTFFFNLQVFLHEIVEKRKKRLYNMNINMKERVHYEAK